MMFTTEARKALVLPGFCALLTLVVLAPVLAPGYVLSYDMVFTPHQPLLPESLGLGPALPRAVPADAVVALVTSVIPGSVVQKLALVAALFGAGYGAGRLVPTGKTGTRLVAAALYGWNAYVAERLFIGHWTLLLGYASLPWVVAAGLRLRRKEPHAWAWLVLASAPAALVPSGGVLATLAGAVAAGWRRAWLAVGIGVLLNAPWWLPGVLRPGGTGSDPAGVAAFGARAEGPGGTVVSVLGLGGIWNADVVPASRTSPLTPLVAVLLVAGTVAGLRSLVRRWGRGPAYGLAALAAAGLVLASAVPLRWAVVHIPGAGLLRDGQKWVAWWALFAALATALAVEALAGRLGGARLALLTGAVVLPVVMLPDLAWGGLGRLSPVDYPGEWSAVRDTLARDPHPGDVVVLPASAFRRFGWNGDRTQLDPAPRFLTRTAIVDDTLVVGASRIRGEDPRAAEVFDAVRAGRPLGSYGVGWVLVENGTPGDVDPRVLSGLTAVHNGQWLSLYRVSGPIATVHPPEPPSAPVLIADAFAIILLCAAGIVTAARLRARLPAGKLRVVNRFERRDTSWPHSSE
jgi:hypothetical protein